jgi:hypothetical protein
MVINIKDLRVLSQSIIAPKYLIFKMKMKLLPILIKFIRGIILKIY